MGAALLLGIWMVCCAGSAEAHHVLGRPAYSLNEDSNTPPSMQVETQIGDFFVTAMVFPAFPRPGEPGRINLYVKDLDSGAPLQADITFSVRDDRWFAGPAEQLGAQVLDDNVYRQGFEFRKAGDYIITASFEARGAPYRIDFPLRVGRPLPVGLLLAAFLVLVVTLAGATVVQRKRLLRAKAALARDEARDSNASPRVAGQSSRSAP